MMKQYPKEYAFFPRTWVLPADQGDLLSYMKSKKKAAFICKPQKGCQGKGRFFKLMRHFFHSYWIQVKNSIHLNPSERNLHNKKTHYQR